MPKARRSEAPQSQQIADRLHLVVNLSATLEGVLEERSHELILPPVDRGGDESQTAPVTNAIAETQLPPRPTQSQRRRQRRLERYEEVVAVQIRPLTSGDQPRTGTSTEDHSPLAPPWTVSRTQAAPSAATESE